MSHKWKQCPRKLICLMLENEKNQLFQCEISQCFWKSFPEPSMGFSSFSMARSWYNSPIGSQNSLIWGYRVITNEVTWEVIDATVRKRSVYIESQNHHYSWTKTPDLLFRFSSILLSLPFSTISLRISFALAQLHACCCLSSLFVNLFLRILRN